MERDIAVDIATKFAVAFPRVPANATQVSGPQWCVRLELPSGLEVRALSREGARVLWANVTLLERIGAPAPASAAQVRMPLDG